MLPPVPPNGESNFLSLDNDLMQFEFGARILEEEKLVKLSYTFKKAQLVSVSF